MMKKKKISALLADINSLEMLTYVRKDTIFNLTYVILIFGGIHAKNA